MSCCKTFRSNKSLNKSPVPKLASVPGFNKFVDANSLRQPQNNCVYMNTVLASWLMSISFSIANGSTVPGSHLSHTGTVCALERTCTAPVLDLRYAYTVLHLHCFTHMLNMAQTYIKCMKRPLYHVYMAKKSHCPTHRWYRAICIPCKHGVSHRQKSWAFVNHCHTLSAKSTMGKKMSNAAYCCQPLSNILKYDHPFNHCQPFSSIVHHGQLLSTLVNHRQLLSLWWANGNHGQPVSNFVK